MSEPVITRDEFVREVRNAFAQLDANHDGYITKGYPVWSTTCSARGGHSGGPLITEGGRGARGILTEGGEGHAVFVEIEAVRDILRMNRICRRGA